VENAHVTVTFVEDKAVSVELPASVVLTVTTRRKAIRGDSANNVQKSSRAGDRHLDPGATVHPHRRKGQNRHPYRQIHGTGLTAGPKFRDSRSRRDGELAFIRPDRAAAGSRYFLARSSVALSGFDAPRTGGVRERGGGDTDSRFQTTLQNPSLLQPSNTPAQKASPAPAVPAMDLAGKTKGGQPVIFSFAASGQSRLRENESPPIHARPFAGNAARGMAKRGQCPARRRVGEL